MSDLLEAQVELADVLALSQVDLGPPADVARLDAILHHIKPGARITSANHGRVALGEVLDTGRFDLERAATATGWLKKARGEHVAENVECGTRSFVYRSRRPFHPARFTAALDHATMWEGNHGDGSACDCCRQVPPEAPEASAGIWSALLPVLACALCPACLTTYTKLLSLVGSSLHFDEALHHVLLAVALALSVGVSAWRSWRSGRAWPLLLAVGGSALVAGGHLLHELHVLEWAGVLVLLVGGLGEHLRSRGRAAAPVLHVR
jgi:hypothetical protein